MEKNISSVREALKFVDAEFEHDNEDLAEITGVKMKCKGCGQPAHFSVTDGDIRSEGDGSIDVLLKFASRHAGCTE